MDDILPENLQVALASKPDISLKLQEILSKSSFETVRRILVLQSKTLPLKIQKRLAKDSLPCCKKGTYHKERLNRNCQKILASDSDKEVKIHLATFELKWAIKLIKDKNINVRTSIAKVRPLFINQ